MSARNMAKKKATKKSAAPKSKTSRKVNKSQAIRDYQAKHPKAGPTEVAKALGAIGVKISPAHVSNVNAVAKKRTSKKAKPNTAKATVGDKVSLAELIDAAAFAEKVGGTEKAKQLLGAIEKLDGK